MEIIEQLMTQLFEQILVSAALRWFLSLEENQIKTWEDICTKFNKQYKYNIKLDVTRRDLKTNKQQHNKSVFTFITRWREKVF